MRRGQCKAKFAAVAGHAITLHANLTPQFLYDAAHDGETKAMAAHMHLIESSEGCEQAGLIVGRNACATIACPEAEDHDSR